MTSSVLIWRACKRDANFWRARTPVNSSIKATVVYRVKGVQGKMPRFGCSHNPMGNATPQQGRHQYIGVCNDFHRGRFSLRYAWTSRAISRMERGRSRTRVAIDESRGVSIFLMTIVPPSYRTAILSAGLNRCFGSRIVRLAGTWSNFIG